LHLHAGTPLPVQSPSQLEYAQAVTFLKKMQVVEEWSANGDDLDSLMLGGALTIHPFTRRVLSDLLASRRLSDAIACVNSLLRELDQPLQTGAGNASPTDLILKRLRKLNSAFSILALVVTSDREDVRQAASEHVSMEDTKAMISDWIFKMSTILLNIPDLWGPGSGRSFRALIAWLVPWANEHLPPPTLSALNDVQRLYSVYGFD
jgi:hypothetical protein